MPLSMFALTVRPLERALGNLSHILDKGLADAQARGFDPAILVQARLRPDMIPLSGQVQRASDSSKALVARLAGLDIPSFADDETSFEQLQDRIARTLAFVRSVGPEQLEGSEDKAISFKAGPHALSFNGLGYLTDFALPNIHFHVTTAYAILRHNGAPLGKLDYLGPLA